MTIRPIFLLLLTTSIVTSIVLIVSCSTASTPDTVPWGGLIFILVLMGILFSFYKLYRRWVTPISTHDDSSQRDPNGLQDPDIHKQDLSTNLYRATEGDTNDNVPDTSDEIRKLASRIRSLEDSIETTTILRRQKEEIEEDLKKYVNGYNFSILKMALNELIEAYEFAIEAEEMLEKSSFPESSEVKKYLSPISMYLRQGLEMAGIEQFIPDTGIPYQITSGCELGEKTPTTDKELVGLISEVERAGWKSTLPTDSTQQEIVRNAQVSVYVLMEK